MRRSTQLLSILGAATILALAANTVSIAATGSGFILGKSNSANTISALTRTTSGTVLKLQSASSANPPLAVNGTGKVTNLNADKVDGLDGAALQTAVWEYTLPSTSGGTVATQFDFPNLPAGRYLASYSVTAEVSNGGLLCGFLFNSNQESATAIGGVGNGYSAVSGAGVVDARTTDVVLRCLTLDPESTWTMIPPTGRVSFTRIDSVTPGTGQTP